MALPSAAALRWRLKSFFKGTMLKPGAYFSTLYGLVLVVWTIFLLRRATHVPQRDYCTSAPHFWKNTSGANVSALAPEQEFGGTPQLGGRQRVSELTRVAMAPGHVRFHTIWSTSSNFSEDRMRTLESIFYHHPNGTLRLYSNELAEDTLSPLTARGFDARIVRFDLHRLLANTPLERWLERLPRWQAGPYYYSHVTDAMRMALLFKDGGVYIDTDVIVVRPLKVTVPAAPAQAKRRDLAQASAPVPSLLQPAPLLPNSIGTEAHTVNNIPVLNGAVMVFGRGSRFLWGAMHDFAATYRDYEWGWNGPELLTRMRLRCPSEVHILPESSFYPFHWEEVDVYSGNGSQELQRDMWELIRRQSFTAHLWNKKSGMLSVAPGSVYDKLLNGFRLVH